MSEDAKVRENRLRRTAERRGLVLRKSRRRDTRALDYGMYWLIDAQKNMHLDPYGTRDALLSLDQVEGYLNA